MPPKRVPILLLGMFISVFNLACPEEWDPPTEDPPPVPWSDGLCNLEGAFFLSDTTFGAQPEGAQYDETECDFDSVGGDDAAHLEIPNDDVDWLDNSQSSCHRGTGTWAYDPILMGGRDGITPVIYVGGVDPDEQEVFLWISYHGAASFWYGDHNNENHCNQIWSFNIDDSENVVGTDLEDYCDAASLYSGHGTASYDCRFGFFPLGVFGVTMADGYQEFTFERGDKTTTFVDGGGAQLHDDTNDTNNESWVDGALDGAYFMAVTFGGDDDVLGTNCDPGDPGDSLHGIDWDDGVNGDSASFVYKERTSRFTQVDPSSFESAIASAQNTAPWGNWTSGCN